MIGTILVDDIESRLELMLEQSWALYMDTLMVLMMEILKDDCSEVYWDILVVMCLAQINALNYYRLIVKFLALYWHM